MLRLLFVMAELRASGMEVMLEACGPAWRGEGIAADVLSTGEETEGALADRLREAGYGVHHIPFLRGPRFLWGYRDLLRQNRYDIVHVHCERANFWLGLVARLAGARVFRTVHAIFRFENGLRIRRRLQRFASRRMGVITSAPSRAVAENERQRFANPCTLLPNWIDEQRFRPPEPDTRMAARRRWGLEDGTFAIVSAGGCTPGKNHEAIIEALAALPDRVRYLHAGDGPLATQEADLAHRLGVKHKVRRLGWVDDMPGLLAAADLFVMPSHSEGLGMAAVEAMASAVPTVLSRADGLSELEPFAAATEWCGTDGMSVAQSILGMMKTDRRAAALVVSDAVRQAYGLRAGLDRLLDMYLASRATP